MSGCNLNLVPPQGSPHESRNIVIIPKYGLCNYLRVIFSWNLYAKSIDKKLIVLWNITQDCPGFFLDYFKPIKNVKILKDYDIESYETIDYEGCMWHPDYDPFKMFIYEGLKPLPYINKIINIKKKIFEGNCYTAVHIRRTDHVNLAKRNGQFTTDKEFIDYISESECNGLYIATDNKVTYDYFKEKFPGKIIIKKYHRRKESRGLRYTSMLDAVLDIYMCVNSDEFMGSGYSSFSELIYHLRAGEILE